MPLRDMMKNNTDLILIPLIEIGKVACLSLAVIVMTCTAVNRATMTLLKQCLLYYTDTNFDL